MREMRRMGHNLHCHYYLLPSGLPGCFHQKDLTIAASKGGDCQIFFENTLSLCSVVLNLPRLFDRSE